MDKWDLRFLEDARHIARNSKDQSTKCGAVIVRPNRTIASQGYNGFPIGMPDRETDYLLRDEKYSRIIHAEMNAILFGRENLSGYTIYIYPFLPCDRCAVCIIQAGIKRVVAPKCPEDKMERWGEIFERSKTYFKECGVEFSELDFK